jgi:hypothetical protein
MLKRIWNRLFGFLGAAAHRKRVPSDLAAGDVCSVEAGESRYGIVKVLATDPDTVHVRVYKEKFGWRPERVDTGGLSLGTMHDDEFGIGHLPLSRAGFGAWTPVRIHREPVSEDELEGFRLWQEARGGVWP